MTNYVVQRQFIKLPEIQGDNISTNLQFRTKNPGGALAAEVSQIKDFVEISILEKEQDFYNLPGTTPQTNHWTDYKVIKGMLVPVYQSKTVLNSTGTGGIASSLISDPVAHTTRPGPVVTQPFPLPPQQGPPEEIEWKRSIPVVDGKIRWYLYLTDYAMPYA